MARDDIIFNSGGHDRIYHLMLVDEDHDEEDPTAGLRIDH
jgi:hypothetical protein